MYEHQTTSVVPLVNSLKHVLVALVVHAATPPSALRGFRGMRRA